MVEDDSDSIQTPNLNPRLHSVPDLNMQIQYGRMQYLFETISPTQNYPSSVGETKPSAQFHLMPAEHLILRRPSGFWPASLSAAWSTGQDPVHTHEETNRPLFSPTVFQKDSESRKMLMMKDLHRGLQCRDEYVELKVGCM